MLITKIKLKNWRNFKDAEAPLRERVYIIGANASGKSNLLDVMRFLRDIAKPEGGGFQKAVKDRGGVTKLRCLAARRDPEIMIALEVSLAADADPVWRYTLKFKSEGKGLQRAIITQERVENLTSGELLIDRPNTEDQQDPDRLTQTALEQISENRAFRDLADFFAAVTYLHLVPQLLKFADQFGGYKLESDPFGQAFLERIAKTPKKFRDARLRKIETALSTCVPNMEKLRFEPDERGVPHIEALYKHWRPDAGWQREDQFSRLANFRNACHVIPHIVLTDLDSCPCPPELLKDWQVGKFPERMLMRIAVREVESWLLADREGIAKLIGVPLAKIPACPDELADPKQVLLNLARKSKSPRFASEFVPAKNSKAQHGPFYNQHLTEFATQLWDSHQAGLASPSLKRSMERIKAFAQGHDAGTADRQDTPRMTLPTEFFGTRKFRTHARRSAWINDLQRGWLENGVNRASPGRCLVDRALARLAARLVPKSARGAVPVPPDKNTRQGWRKSQ